MNKWGSQRIPFLFIIDFEMEMIRLYRLDEPLPANILYSFHGRPELPQFTGPGGKDLTLSRHPISFKRYKEAFEHVQGEIFAGNSFLANLTFPTPINTGLTLRELFLLSHAPYKILVDGCFVCFSPESFISIKEGVISTKPMKGTVSASRPDAHSQLMNDPKEVAEHNTIVDLLRNDLSMVAGKVELKRFRYTETIKSQNGAFIQVSSEISGILPVNYHQSLGTIIFTLLPAGSVTGAPKIKTVAIINKAENDRRGYYTGICGIFDGRNVDSAVMIRFIELNDGNMQFRSGGGITFMSRAEDEYNELIEKIYVPVA